VGIHWRSQGVRGCGPHLAALARGGKRAKIVLKNSRENSDCVISYVFACNKNKALQLQRVPILSILGYNIDLYHTLNRLSSFQNLRRKGGKFDHRPERPKVLQRHYGDPDPPKEGETYWGRQLRCGLSSKFFDHLLLKLPQGLILKSDFNCGSDSV